MLEPLIDGQDDHLAGTAKFSVHQHAAQLAFDAGCFTFVICKNTLDGT
jgi:hypothetical protein